VAFNPNEHIIDPDTGFMRHAKTGHHVSLTPPPPGGVALPSDYPKWVVPHVSHIVLKTAADAPAHVSTPGWPTFHVNRETKEVSVLVADEDEEKRALADLSAPTPEDEAVIAESFATEHPRSDFAMEAFKDADPELQKKIAVVLATQKGI